MATTFGHPTDSAAIHNDLKKLIQEYDLPPVVFHSLRHTSVTYKLKLNDGDIKAVQGDSGHAQVNMVTDVYSHILDDDRKKNAELFEDAFYGKKETDPQMHRKKPKNTIKVPEGVDAELLAKVLSNPEMAALLASPAKTMKRLIVLTFQVRFCSEDGNQTSNFLVNLGSKTVECVGIMDLNGKIVLMEQRILLD